MIISRMLEVPGPSLFSDKPTQDYHGLPDQELTGQQITDTLHLSLLGWLRLIHPCVTCIVKSI